MSWNKAELTSVCEVFSDGDWIESKDQSEDGIRLIQTGNIGFGRFKARDSKARYISEETFKRLRCTEIKQGDILVSRLPDPVGRACVIPKLDEKSITAVDCTIIRTKKEILTTEFLNYFCQSPQYFEQVRRNITGATRQRISRVMLGKTEIPLPPLATQQKIVAKLDAIFAEIDKATVAAEANVKNAEALFQSHLTEVFERGGEGWVIKNLLELANEDCSLSYGIVQPGDDFENGLPIVRPTNLTKKYIPKLELKTINPTLADSYRRTTLTGEELLLCVRGTTGTVSISTEELKGCNVTRGIVPIRFKKKLIDLDYAYYLFNSSVIQKQIKSKTYGAALLQINIADVKKLQLPVPKIEEQNKIVAQLDAVSSYIDILKTSQVKKKQSLIDFKQSILKQAFNGELVQE